MNIDEENKNGGIEFLSHVDSKGSEVQTDFTEGSEDMEQSTSNATPADIPTEDGYVWRSSRINKGQPPQRLSYMAKVEPIPEPQSWKEMSKLTGSERKKWEMVAEEEMNSLKENSTWELMELPEGRNTIGC